MSAEPEGMLVLGRISGLYGVQGWVKIYSFTDPRENILHYGRWRLLRNGQWQTAKVVEGKRHGKGVIARLDLFDDRERAREYIGAEIAVPRDALPPLPFGEYYWADLEGLRVETVEGVDLGVVDHLMETGANDVLVVEGERTRLVPFVQGSVVTSVDLDSGVIRVDWDPEF